MRALLVAVLAVIGLAGAAEGRPLVVILAETKGTEVTDMMTPYAILSESGAADVRIVAASDKPVRLMPGAAWVAPQMTLAQLARERPQGPDVVIVPAVHDEKDPVLHAWLRDQARNGVRIMSICNGGLMLAASGLLDGKQATLHWYSIPKVQKAYPTVTWRRDQRWVTDGRITTTAGVSASVPASLHLLRELAGEDVMRRTAQRLSLPLPDQRHNGRDFHLTTHAKTAVIGNTLAVWGHQAVAVPISPGFDELAFASALDGWSRTYRSNAWATGPASVTSRHGLTVFRAASLPARFDRQATLRSAGAMEGMFGDIQAAYGASTARFVAMQLEHPWGAASLW
jgi:putative intracellular protease/amidase